MKVLVLATSYPDNNGCCDQMFIHIRSLYYRKMNIDVDVLNFNKSEGYKIDDINVVTMEMYKKQNKEYDILLIHAPNLRYHYRFLMRYGNKFSNIIFFFHGHEILKISKTYPKPYSYKHSFSKLRDIYDIIKIRIWRKYIENNIEKINLIFVSNKLYNLFIFFTKIDPVLLSRRIHIINNSIGEVFEKYNYVKDGKKDFDFITIRSNLDNSTYCLDLVNKLALQNPQYKFCIAGKGEFFNYYSKADNIKWIDKTFNHNEIMELLNNSKYAIMLVRHDTQGVMSCEMASFGIPLITSDIEVCREIFSGFENVIFINNDFTHCDLTKVIEKIKPAYQKNEKYFAKSTIDKEVLLFEKVLRN